MHGARQGSLKGRLAARTLWVGREAHPAAVVLAHL